LKNYKHYFQELCERINYSTIIFIQETSQVLAFSECLNKKVPKLCSLNVNYSAVKKENSKVFYGHNLTIDNETKMCSGSFNIIDINGLHVVIVFYNTDIKNFRDNQLPRILWKNTKHVYLGHSDYVPSENKLNHSMVGFCDNELFSDEFYQSFKKSDDAVFTKEVCFWNTIGTIKDKIFSSMIKYQKFPYYSMTNQLEGIILVYTLINEITGMTSENDSSDEEETLLLIKKSLSEANLFLAIQNFDKDKKIKFMSQNFSTLGYDLQEFIDGKIAFEDIVFEEDKEQYIQETEDILLLKKETYKTKLRLINTSNQIVYSELTIVPLLSPTNDIKSLALIIEFLNRNEKHNNQFFKLLNIINKGNIVYTIRPLSNPYCFQLLTENFSQFGYSHFELMMGKCIFTDIIFHEDVEMYKNQIEKLITHQLHQIEVEYRLISSRRQLHWISEKLYLTDIDGVEYIESSIRNITTSKRAFDELNVINQFNQVSLESNKQLKMLELNFDQVLKQLKLEKIVRKLSNSLNIDVAFLNNSDAFLISPSGEKEAYEHLKSTLKNHVCFSMEEEVSSSYDNVFFNIIPIINDDFRIGTLVVYGLIEDTTSTNPLPVSNHHYRLVKSKDIEQIRQNAEVTADNLGYMMFTTTLALMQTQSSSIYQGDLSRQRHSHGIILEILNLANTCETIEDFFESMFPIVANAFQLSRGSLFEYNEEKKLYSCALEWFSDIDFSRISSYQNINIEDTFFREWQLDEQNSFSIDYEEDIKENADLRKYAKAIVGIRISNKDKLYGILNFVDNHSLRNWKNDDIIVFEDIGYIMSYVIEKTFNKEQIDLNQIQLVKTLDSLPNAIAIYECETSTLLHVNKQFMKIFGQNKQKSKKELDQYLKQIIRSEKANSITKEVYFLDLDLWFLLNKSHIIFEKNSEACMMILTDISENKKYAEMMSSLAFHDVLTDLPNRVKFEHDINKTYELNKEDYEHSFVGIVNIDNFKMINNTFGYQYGDALLKSMAKQLNHIPEIRGNVYRFGGDEFSFFVNNKYETQVYEIANKVMNLFQSPFFVEGYETYLTVSLGIGFLTDSDKNLNDLIRKANLSLFEAKTSGKNKFILYDTSLQKYEEDTLSLERALKTALDEGYGEFEVYFQPIVSAKTGKIIGAEALARWFSKEFGYISPVKFIPIAESTGLIIPLGKYILNQACKEAKKWLDYGYDLQIAVNFSVIQTFQSDLISTILNALHTYRIPAGNLIIEITESLAIKDINKVVNILNTIKQIGVKIALDDFGTGYSSLSHLRRLPLDIVKIDRSFIFNVDYDPYSLSFIDTIAKFCHLNNTKVCCEGVENETQKGLLKGIEIDTLQGYLFAKPAPAEEFWKLLIKE